MKASKLAFCAALAVSAPQVMAQPLCVPLSPEHWDEACNLDFQFPLEFPLELELPSAGDQVAESATDDEAGLPDLLGPVRPFDTEAAGGTSAPATEAQSESAES